MPHKIFFCFLLLISLTFGANDDAREIGKAVSDIEHLQKNYEKLDGKIDEVEKNQKSVEEYKNIIDRQDKRIEDVNSKISSAAEKTSWIANIFGFLTAILAIVGIAFPWWLNKENKKAQVKIEKEVKRWKEEAKAEFEAELERFKNFRDEKTKEIDKHVSSVEDKASESNRIITNITNKSLEDIPKMAPTISVQDRKEIKEEERKLTQKAEKEKSFEDWTNALNYSFYLGNYGDALQNAEQALAFAKENELQKAIALYNKGVVLGQQNKTEEAIKTYDKIYEEFGTSQNEEIRVRVAKALYNKGVRLGQQNKTEEAIKTYDKLYEEFGTSQNEEIRVRIAKALVNKGVALGQQNKTEEEIKTYDKVYEKFGTSQNEEIRVGVTMALVNKGITLGQQGDNKEAKEQFLKSIEFNPSHLDAYTNIFGLWLVTGNEFDEKIVSQFLENARENKQALLKYEMIATIKASLLSNQSEKIKELKDKYSGVGFGGWEWNGLEAWAQDMTDGAASARVLEAISEFKLF